MREWNGRPVWRWAALATTLCLSFAGLASAPSCERSVSGDTAADFETPSQGKEDSEEVVEQDLVTNPWIPRIVQQRAMSPDPEHELAGIQRSARMSTVDAANPSGPDRPMEVYFLGFLVIAALVLVGGSCTHVKRVFVKMNEDGMWSEDAEYDSKVVLQRPDDQTPGTQRSSDTASFYASEGRNPQLHSISEDALELGEEVTMALIADDNRNKGLQNLTSAL